MVGCMNNEELIVDKLMINHWKKQANKGSKFACCWDCSHKIETGETYYDELYPNNHTLSFCLECASFFMAQSLNNLIDKYILIRAEADGYMSQLLDVQKDCIRKTGVSGTSTPDAALEASLEAGTFPRPANQMYRCLKWKECRPGCFHQNEHLYQDGIEDGDSCEITECYQHKKAGPCAPVKPTMTRKEFLALPIEERRKIINHQITEMFNNIPDEVRLEELHNLD